MRVAGLLGEGQYQATKARLEAQLDTVQTTAPAADLPPLTTASPQQPAFATYQAYGTAAPYAPQPPPPPAAPEWAPPAAQPWQQPQPGGGRRTTLIATGLTIALLAAAFAGVAVVTRSNPPNTLAGTAANTPVPTATPTPDAAAALASLRTAPAPKDGSVVITHDQADKLVRAFWPVREAGLSHRNPDTIRAIEDGPAREWDVIGCTMGCPPPNARSIRDVHLFVPLQTRFPASFMAHVLTTEYHTSGPQVEIFVFTRQSATAPWTISFNAYYSQVDHIIEAATEDPSTGLEATPPVDPSHVPSALPGMLAAYWQHWKDTGSAPPNTQFGDSYFTTQIGQGLWATRQDDHTLGLDEHVAYSADNAADGMWSFAVSTSGANATPLPGRVLTCGTVRYRAVTTPLKAGGAVVQSVDFDPFGNLLRPGRYSSVTESGLHMSCILTAPGRPIFVTGAAGQQTKVFGVSLDGSGASA